MDTELTSAILSHDAGISCFVFLSDSIVAGTMPKRILPRFRWRRDWQRAVCIHDEIQLDPAVCSFAGHCAVAQRPQAGQYCAQHVGHLLQWVSDQAPVCHASILSVALWLCFVTPFVLCHFIPCHSFRTLCILFLLLLPVWSGIFSWKAPWSCFEQLCKDVDWQSGLVRDDWWFGNVRELLSKMSLLSLKGRQLFLLL